MPTKQPLDGPLSAIFIGCRDFYLTNAGQLGQRGRGEPYKQMKRALTASLLAMASLHAVKYPGWAADKRHAGYLVKFDPPMLFWVPYHVLPAFPTGEELEALWRLSRTIRSGDRSVIAISGSNVLRKIFDIVGDVDFCEYFPVADAGGFDKISSNMDGDSRIACVRLSLQDKEWRYPWGDDRPTKEFFAEALDSVDENRSVMKVDYVGDVDKLGVTEITNLIIAVDERGWSAGFAKTFAAQEAPLVPIDWLPNQMNEPIEMGRYIDWLTRSVVALNDKGDLRKCLKRCASLARVLFIPGITDAIATLADNNSIFLGHKVSELEKLYEFFKSLPDDRSKGLAALISQQLDELAIKLAKSGGAPDMIARKRFDDEARLIVKRLLRHVRPGGDPGSRRAA